MIVDFGQIYGNIDKTLEYVIYKKSWWKTNLQKSFGWLFYEKRGRIETGEGNYPMITVGAIFHVLLVLIKTKPFMF